MLSHTRCPLGGSEAADRELYPANFDAEQISAHEFSARRMPDRIHYRMVRNTETGCLRADPVLDADTVRRLYERSRVEQTSAAEQAAETYRHYLPRALRHVPACGHALEIGCGHGAFLHALRETGFERATGLELSAHAIESAPEPLRPHILQEPMRPGLFEPGSLSLVCGFQVLDHLLEPNECLAACREALAPGGAMFWICHDAGAPVSKILGRRSPIVDIEHPVLYSRQTVRRLFERNGFAVKEVFGVANRYPLSYWARMAPLPKRIKAPLQRLLDWARLGHWRLRVNFGNMGIIAVKPRKARPYRE